MSLPPGISWIAPRRMLPALRSTRALVIGLKPITTVSIVKPGMFAALSAKYSRGLWMPRKSTLHLRRDALGDVDRGAALDDVALRRGALLDGVRQLVRDQLLAAGALRLELVAAEEDVAADVNALALSRGALLRGRVAGVDADVAEVGAEARLHLPAHAGGQRRTGANVHGGRRRRAPARRAVARPRAATVPFVPVLLLRRWPVVAGGSRIRMTLRAVSSASRSAGSVGFETFAGSRAAADSWTAGGARRDRGRRRAARPTDDAMTHLRAWLPNRSCSARTGGGETPRYAGTAVAGAGRRRSIAAACWAAAGPATYPPSLLSGLVWCRRARRLPGACRGRLASLRLRRRFDSGVAFLCAPLPSPSLCLCRPFPVLGLMR